MSYTNSSLATIKELSPKYNADRKINGVYKTITRFTPHCNGGHASAQNLAKFFKTTDRDVSCNYCIGDDGTIALIVEEKNRSWCSGGTKTVNGMTGSLNDYEAITVEVSSDSTSPYAFTNAAYNALIDLCVDCCKRNGKTKVIWKGTAEATEAYAKNGQKDNEMLLTVHRWYATKSCPGDWLFNRMQEFCDIVNTRLNENDVIYRVQIGAYKVKANAEKQLEKAKAAGFNDAFITKA